MERARGVKSKGYIQEKVIDLTVFYLYKFIGYIKPLEYMMWLC